MLWNWGLMAWQQSPKRSGVSTLMKWQQDKRYCLTLDLKDDPELIAEYEAYHQAVWTEVLQSIKESGIVDMEIYR